MRRQSGRSGAFWLQLTLQTAALISAATAAEYEAGYTKQLPGPQTIQHFVVPDLDEDAFLYSESWQPSSLSECDMACETVMQDFNRPVLMPNPEFDLLGGLDALQELDGQDWLFVY